MGFKTKIQRVDRPTNQSFYAIIPTALAQSFELDKAEDVNSGANPTVFSLQKLSDNSSMI